MCKAMFFSLVLALVSFLSFTIVQPQATFANDESLIQMAELGKPAP